MADRPHGSTFGQSTDDDECRHWDSCDRCGGDGAHEYGGHPLDDYIDADPTRLVTCDDCHGNGTLRTCHCALCRSGGCCYA